MAERIAFNLTPGKIPERPPQTYEISTYRSLCSPTVSVRLPRRHPEKESDGVERLRALGFHNVQEISFGGPSRDRNQANMRAYMWFRLKEWLGKGAIPEEEGLASQLAGPGPAPGAVR